MVALPPLGTLLGRNSYRGTHFGRLLTTVGAVAKGFWKREAASKEICDKGVVWYSRSEERERVP